MASEQALQDEMVANQPIIWLSAITWLQVGVALLVCWLAYKQVVRWKAWRQNEKKAERKRANRQASLQRVQRKVASLDSQQVAAIIRLPFEQLQHQLRTGQLTATKVLQAYQSQALAAHGNTNCLTEFITEAEEWAAEADRVGSAGRLLHGVPVSLKDDVPLKGYDSTLGLSCLCDLPSPIDHPYVQLLKQHGAIPFCRTNLAQFTFSFASSNPIFGETLNPHKLDRIPGGSSGGESALVASGGSILGLGSDLGGSVRIPSAFTGLFGLRPTHDRSSTLGLDMMHGAPHWDKALSIRSVKGPLARDVATIVAVARILLDGNASNAIDPTVVPVPFNEEEYKDSRPLRIGYYHSVHPVTAAPVVRKAVDTAVQHLKSKGHEVVEWQPPHAEELINIWNEILLMDGLNEVAEILKHEPADQCIEVFNAGCNVPQCLRPMLASWYRNKDEFCSHVILSKKDRSGPEYLKLTVKLMELKRSFMTSWREAGLDAVLAPPHPSPAPRTGEIGTSMSSLCYSAMYNALNFPAGIVPITRVSSQDIEAMTSYPANHPYEKGVKRAMEGAEGLPVGVMVVAPFYRDERCLRLMGELEGASDYPVNVKFA